MTTPLPTHRIDSGIGTVRPGTRVNRVRFLKSQGEDSAFAVTCGGDGAVRLHNFLKPAVRGGVETFLIHTFSKDGHSGGENANVLDAVLSEDGSRLASGGDDRALVCWDVFSGTVVRRFTGHLGPVTCCAPAPPLAPDLLITGSQDMTIRVWDARASSASQQCVQVISRQFKDNVTSVCAAGTEIIACSVDGSLRVFDVRTARATVATSARPLGSMALANSFATTRRVVTASLGVEGDARATVAQGALRVMVLKHELKKKKPHDVEGDVPVVNCKYSLQCDIVEEEDEEERGEKMPQEPHQQQQPGRRVKRGWIGMGGEGGLEGKVRVFEYRLPTSSSDFGRDNEEEFRLVVEIPVRTVSAGFSFHPKLPMFVYSGGIANTSGSSIDAGGGGEALGICTWQRA